jgi:hypothetical protein
VTAKLSGQEEEVDVMKWATPLLGRLDTRDYRRRILRVGTGVTVMLFAILLVAIIYFDARVYANSLGFYEAVLSQFFYRLPWIFGGVVCIGIAYGIMDSVFLGFPSLTLPQAYSLLILRVLQREASADKLDDSVRRLVKRTNADLEELEENLAASRTVKVLKLLRRLLLKFATAVRNVPKDPEVVKSMSGTLQTAASMFYRFEDVEKLDSYFEPELKNVIAISERTSIMSPLHGYVRFSDMLLRKCVKLPFPVVMVAVFLSFGILGYYAYLASPFYAILVGFGLTIVLGFRGQVAAWLRSRVGE